ncbi:hypothetical protein QG37_02424 [Candidozyma auris]|uniref:Uncharacterized protein n=1 Tax=Candidozyma auris TaxID=498019 RepID=A0A0L0P1Y6_CANAR|nr:hypothetical protein QG37_02424 [[Candida] auris]
MTKEASAPQDKPVFGASGRKIIYDKDGKPYVQFPPLKLT